MGVVISVDVGGTFTDAVAIDDGKIYTSKTPTTIYDLSIAFMKLVDDLSSQMQVSPEELLEKTESIEYSTTLAMNALIEKKGARVGLLLTKGATVTHVLGKGASFLDGVDYKTQRNASRATKPDPIVPPEFTIEVDERIDSSGNVIKPLNEERVRRDINRLISKGVNVIAVCLLNSFINPVHELRIREIVEEEYPSSYIGAVPVVLSHEVAPKRNEYSRVNATILNAYLHYYMAEQLFRITDELRIRGYRKPLMMLHNSGGVVELFRTTALQTFDAGLVAGMVGSAELGRLLGYENIVFSDVGGTSFDVGVIVKGSTRVYSWNPLIGRYMINISKIETKTIGAGGGSIAKVIKHFKSIEVGPESAGAFPGPACYDQGGTEPTVTDADLVLGYLNPNYFHGGKILLNEDAAKDSIEEKIAEPLGLDLIEAAALIKKVIDGKMSNLLMSETVLKGYDPKDFVLFAYGGAGPTHCCGFGFRAGFPKIIVPLFAPVFCAYGGTLLDYEHIWEYSKHMVFLEPGTQRVILDFDEFNAIVKELQERALEEIKIEGLPTENVIFGLELEMRFGRQPVVHRFKSPHMFIKNEKEAREVYDAFAREYAEVYSHYTVLPELGVDIENFYLTATIPRPKIKLPEYGIKGREPSDEAYKGTRKAYFEKLGDMIETPIYEMGSLEPGNEIEGPAIIEAPNTTLVLEPDTKLQIDRYLFARIEKVGGG